VILRRYLGPLLTAVGTLVMPAAVLPTAAAPAATIASLSVDVWPEHDDPRILVIYRGTLSADTPLPYALAVSIPAGAQVHAVAYRRDGQLLSTRYEATAAGSQIRITFSVPVPDFQFEYYLDVLSPPPQRTFTVGVVFPLPVANLQVSVEQPLRSSGLTLTPATSRTTASGGFVYHLYTEQQWPAGKIWSVRGTYRKDDSAPSLAPATAPPPAGPSGPSVEGGRSFFWLLAALIGLLVGIGGSVLVGYLRRRSSQRRRPPAGPLPRRQGRKARQGVEGGQLRYCASCGRRAGPRDRFCSNCGRPLPDAG